MVEGALARRLIFHADDMPSDQEAVALALDIHGPPILHVVGTVAEALAYIPEGMEQDDPLAAIIDGDFPDGNGSEIAGVIRESGLVVPIIAFSAHLQTFGDFNIQKPDFRGLVDALTHITDGPAPVNGVVRNVEQTPSANVVPLFRGNAPTA